MKRSISKSRSLILILCTILLVLPSCRSHSSCATVVQNGSELFSIVRSVDTIVLHDSVYVREMMRGDTIYLTRTEYRDRWRLRVERDTVVDVRVEKEVVQLPPERYVPKFYRWCTGLLFAIGLSAMGYGLLKWRLHL